MFLGRLVLTREPDYPKNRLFSEKETWYGDAAGFHLGQRPVKNEVSYR